MVSICSNALATVALCRGIGLPLAPLLHALRDYKGEPHRVELVNTIAGVTYFDDSKGTNVGATVAALKGLGAETGGDQARIILLAGGDGRDRFHAQAGDTVCESGFLDRQRRRSDTRCLRSYAGHIERLRKFGAGCVASGCGGFAGDIVFIVAGVREL